MADMDEILDAYTVRRDDVLALINTFRRARKFNIYGMVYQTGSIPTGEVMTDMARFLISHLGICDDGALGSEAGVADLRAAMADGHPVADDVSSLLAALYPIPFAPHTTANLG
ncbi:MAG: hypothetical protein CVV05_01555 [Gammaproteobacteria bacterium HGW-Gammaproteobacteria-1]|jgi:hypothetical protein|nr:MAG: hypothetical protein CVV05_01555 [Gammaproteobacteria bacterium HGW-Gammaproteobacteria-1]